MRLAAAAVAAALAAAPTARAAVAGGRPTVLTSEKELDKFVAAQSSVVRLQEARTGNRYLYGRNFIGGLKRYEISPGKGKIQHFSPPESCSSTATSAPRTTTATEP